ncbi:TetR/AcrR family transcriptional regulator [Amycolatopsis magusensis]|uniref:AcrR family transcriptional regulator n=1 Tax=Amycolatopsis magusensis TaxID=882444 RepID=A0ABS4Q242_9PSEU|nr:TetR/AcrR family transcriptional regulator [Amycolatopsis magusensis]MBP2185736.1 AcrR family transcriptional regulator [Amycolatopsis magusensis]MDI5979692.1 TetR/AcrR family transcriptional regulator [Amycolatopsis magusensis]
MRRDAQLNREKLIEAARTLFAERGLNVALEEVARRAGVSIGTLYNRFPSREQLCVAVFADRAEAVDRAVEQALATPDAWTGFVQFLERICLLQAADRGFNDLAARGLPPVALSKDPQSGYENMVRLIARAQREGALREDFTPPDLAFVTWSITRTIEATAAVKPDLWRRHLALLCDGLRAEAAHPLPVPSLGQEELADLMQGKC